MRLKSELYKKEQQIIVDKLLAILDLEHNHPLMLYHLDNNQELQQKIMNLIPEIHTFLLFMKCQLYANHINLNDPIF